MNVEKIIAARDNYRWEGFCVGGNLSLLLYPAEPWAEAQRNLGGQDTRLAGIGQPGAFQGRLLELDALLLSSPGQYCGVKSLVMGVQLMNVSKS